MPDQPLPNPNSEDYVQDTIVPRFSKAVDASKKRGVDTYGTALQPFNGRDAVRDAWEEWLDLGMYLEQIRRERDEAYSILNTLMKCNLTLPNFLEEHIAVVLEMGTER